MSNQKIAQPTAALVVSYVPGSLDHQQLSQHETHGKSYCAAYPDKNQSCLSNLLQYDKITHPAASPKKKRSILQVGKYAHQVGDHWTPNEITALADEMVEWIEVSGRYWLRDFFTARRITRRSVSRFMQTHEYFREMYSLALDIQESHLISRGMNYNAATAIFCLKNIHGWRDFKEVATAISITSVNQAETDEREGNSQDNNSQTTT